MKKTNEFLLNKLEELNDSLLNIYPEYLLSQQEELNNKMEEVKEMDFIDLIQDRSRLEDLMEKNIEAPQEEVPSIDELLEDFIKLFAYNREVKRRANILEQKLRRGE